MKKIILFTAILFAATCTFAQSSTSKNVNVGIEVHTYLIPQNSVIEYRGLLKCPCSRNMELRITYTDNSEEQVLTLYVTQNQYEFLKKEVVVATFQVLLNKEDAMVGYLRIN